MKKQQGFLTAILGVFVSFLILNLLLVEVANAERFYHGDNPNGLNECIATSGHANIWSVSGFACPKAYDGDVNTGARQNACATWLGPSGNSHTTTARLYAPSETAVIGGISFWGMCTDRSDTLSALYVINAGPGGNGHGVSGTGIEEKRFTRTGNWGSPNSIGTQIHVADFIRGLTPSIENGQKVYRRRVFVDRYHSNTPSAGIDISDIIIVIGEKEPENPDLCRAWEPSSYPASGSNGGTTSIVVKAMNTAGRFPAGMSGDWHHNGPGGLQGPIYAMPTDNIRWHSCYYPGIQASAKTDVSDINGTTVNGGADGTWEYEWSKSTYVYLPDGRENCRDHHPSVGYKMLYRGWAENIGSEWQNKYLVGSDLGSAAGGDYGPGEYTWRNDFQRDGNRSMGTSRGGDVGRVLTQKGITGIPIVSSIGSETPSHDIHDWVTHYRPKYDDYTIQQWKLLYGIDLSGVTEPYDVWEVVCTNSFSDDIRSASVHTGPATDDATVIVPYNFKNSTGVALDRDVVYSAEEVGVDEVWVDVGTKWNSLTYATYATVVPEAEVRMFMYVSSSNGGGGMTSGDASCDDISSKQCKYVTEVGGLKDLNAGGSLSGTSDSSSDGTSVGKKLRAMVGKYNAFDATAGDYICFITAVNPYTSGADDAHGDSAGDGTWKFGSPDCAVIAKKPTFQVWGDSLYSYKGGVEGNVSKKRYLYRNYFRSKTNLGSFRPKGGSYTITNFTSWVEESLNISNGATTTVASGAATGYKVGDKTRAGTTGTICDVSPLTLSNAGCNINAGVGNSGILSTMISASLVNSGDKTNRDELIKYWVGNGTVVKGSCGTRWGGTCKTVESASGETVRYVTGGSMSVSGTIGKRETYLVQSSGNVTIDSNLVYTNTNYTLVQDIPKVIIYANNININCWVERVDAILITKPGGTLNTCYNDGGNVNARQRSTQLKIFGTVLTDKIVLGRTYGAAAWNGSHNGGRTTDEEPAEIFDYDSTIPMWSEYMSGSAETDTLQITYQHELAPRY